MLWFNNNNNPSFMPNVPHSLQSEEVAEPIAPLVEKKEENVENVENVEDDKELLPRDILLAKAKAFRDSQGGGKVKEEPAIPQSASQGENHVGEGDSLMAARQMAEEIGLSPFASEQFDIPAYLRKKTSQDSENPID